jgi:hypothetical protein
MFVPDAQHPCSIPRRNSKAALAGLPSSQHEVLATRQEVFSIVSIDFSSQWEAVVLSKCDLWWNY